MPSDEYSKKFVLRDLELIPSVFWKERTITLEYTVPAVQRGGRARCLGKVDEARDINVVRMFCMLDRRFVDARAPRLPGASLVMVGALTFYRNP
jgi:hypothetical protein